MPTGGDSASNLDLRDYLLALRRRKVIALLCFAAVVGSAMALSYAKETKYSASARVLLQPSLREQIVNPQAQVYVDPIRSQKTEIQIINSPAVSDRVTRKIGPNGGVAVTPLPDADILVLRAVDPSAARAAAVANAYVDAYIEFRQGSAADDLKAAGDALQLRIDDLQQQIDTLRQAERSTTAGSEETQAPAAGSPELDAAISQQILLKEQLSQINAGSSTNSGGVRKLAPAVVPATPFSPDHKRDAALAVAIGLVFAVGVALLWEFVDDSIESKEDVTRLTPEAPVLATVPVVRSWRDRSKPLVVSLADPDSAASEAFKSLRTSIHFAKLERQITLIQITSASPGEGKTSTIANLAVALARTGNRVVVVDCDLRRPRMHEFLQCSNAPGFVSVLLGDASLSAALQNVPGVPRLKFMAAGPPPPNPSELLSSGRANDVFHAVREIADVVLVDCPPLLPVTDSVVLSDKVDATLLLVTIGSTTRRQLRHALDLLAHVHAPLIGTVLNGTAADGGYGYSYAYKRDQRREPKARRSSVRKTGPLTPQGQTRPSRNGHVPVELGLSTPPPVNGASPSAAGWPARPKDEPRPGTAEAPK